MLFRVRPWDRWASKLAGSMTRPGVATRVAPRTGPPPEHDLVLYEFEASPWCRLVREHATILDLTLSIKPCPRETLLFGEGTFGPFSRFRPEAMAWYRAGNDDDQLTVPLLVDRTQQSRRNNNQKHPGDTASGETNNYSNNNNNNNECNTNGAIVLTESYSILSHLWETYGDSVLPGKGLRPDQVANDLSRSFGARFLSLAGPSYLRPLPRCGLMRVPSIPTTNTSKASSHRLVVLYQSEGCPESRLVREALCCLEIPYVSVPVAEGSRNSVPAVDNSVTQSIATTTNIPVLEVLSEAGDEPCNKGHQVVEHHLVGADQCLRYLNETWFDQTSTTKLPSWFDPVPTDNLGRTGGPHFSIVKAALSAMRKGQAALVPEKAMK